MPSHYLNQYWNIVILTLRNKLQWIFLSKLKHFHWQICIWKCHLPKWRPSCPGLNVLNHAIRVDPLSLGRCMNMFKKIWFWMTIVASISWALSAKLHWDEGQNSKLTLVQVMTWCRQATSYYLSQCRHSSLLPYGITWPQWVNGTNSVTVQVNVSLAETKWPPCCRTPFQMHFLERNCMNFAWNFT